MEAKFASDRNQLLSRLEAGRDLSPKGQIDKPIAALVQFINGISVHYVTTSSCSGRISVYESGGPKVIRWLLVRHGVITTSLVKAALISASTNAPLVNFKCEPFILHVQCSNLESASVLQLLAISCGVRETGLSVGKRKVILAIRTTANGLELPIASGPTLLVSDDYLDVIVEEANKKLRRNFEKLDKFLSLLKLAFKWPSCAVNSAVNINRWAHSSISLPSSRLLVLGGYGAASSSSSSSAGASRGVDSTLVNTSSGAINPIQLPFEAGMHSASSLCSLLSPSGDQSDAFEVLLVCGGRASPQTLLPLLQIFHQSKEGSGYQAITFVEEGVRPSLRWGHSLTRLGDGLIMLFGGRDESAVFGDCYLLSLSVATNSSIVCQWTEVKQVVTPPSDTSSQQYRPESIKPRFFHSATALTNYTDLYYVSHTSVQAATDHVSLYEPDHVGIHTAVLIHGGVLGLADSQDCGSMHVIYLFRNSASTNGAVSNVYRLELHEDPLLTRYEKSSLESDGDPVSVITKDAGDESEPTLSDPSNTGQCVRRFGHTLTDIGSNTVLLAGGTSFSPLSLPSVLAVHYGVDDQNNIVIFSCRAPTVKHPVDQPLSDKLTDRVLDDMFPCSRCRVHHTAAFHDRSTEISKRDSTLHLMGGGAHCLGFGPHYCDSVCLSISFGYSPQPHRESVHAREGTSLPATDLATVSTNASSEAVVIAKASMVKLLKTWLEKQHFTDKQRRITELADVSVDLYTATLDPDFTSVTHAESLEHHSLSLDGNEKLMAVPISPLFDALLRKDRASLTEAEQALLRGLSHGLQLRTLQVAYQQTKVSKSVLSNSNKKAAIYLDTVVRSRGLSPSARASFPQKYELVSDVLMLPEHSFQGHDWDFLRATSPTAPAATGPSAFEFWSGLAACFSTNRVAQKARIDGGPKRESRVVVLWSSPTIPADSADGCWVTVVENKVSFSFDLTR